MSTVPNHLKTLKDVEREQLEEQLAFSPRRKVGPAPYVDPILRAEREYQDWLYATPEEKRSMGRYQ